VELRAGESTDEITEAMMRMCDLVEEVILSWQEKHRIPLGMVERTETAQERTQLVVERAGDKVMSDIRRALGW